MGIKTKLNSSQVARLVDLLSEGEIEGFPSASGLTPETPAYYLASLKDTFFNNTPVLDATATVTSSSTKDDAAIVEKLNFDMRDARFESRLGKQDQLPLENIDDLNQSTVAVNAEVLKNGDIGTNTGGGGFFDYLDGSPATPVTRQITDTDVTSVRLTIGSPAMTVSKDDGRLRGVRIDYSIEIQYQGGGYNRVDFGDYDEKNVYLGNGRFTHIGFSPDLYQRKHLINLDPAKIQAGTAFPVDIRVTSLGKEFNSDTLAQNDELIWYDITLKVGEKTRYPNSAVVGLLFNAEQFPSIPQRSYKIRGIKVRLPHNATVRSDGSVSYSGTFNGTLKTTSEWTTDPPFILYNLLTNTRYGLGSQVLTPEERAKDAAGTFTGASDVAENLDIYSFQKASEYCGELINNEPRFACNVLLQTQQEAFKLIEEMCSVFRAMPFWELGGITVAQDAPDVFAYTFNQSNVTQAGFSYSGSSLKNRPTCVSVKYFDNNLRDFAYELVELAQTSFKPVRKYGYNKKNITAFACTSRAQARRLGLWFLYSAHNETEVCSFETDVAAGITVRPGDLIKVGDPVRAGKTVAGRVTSGSTTTSVKLDRTSSDMFGTQVPSTFTLNVITESRNSDGSAKIDPRTDALIYEVEAIAECTISGNTVSMPSGTTLNSAPVAGSAFSIGYDGLALSLWRVLSVVENEATYAITALAHERDKYSVIDADHTFTPRDVTQLAEKPDPITNLRLQEISFEEGDKVLQRVAITWQESPRASQYEVVVRLDSDNEETHFVTTTGFDVMDSQKGVYNVSVTAIGYALDPEQSGKRRSSPVAASIRTEGRTAIPSNIASLNITPIDQHNAELHWPEPTDLDVKIGGTIEIRHNPRTTGDIKWAQSEKIVPAVNGSTTRKIVPLLDGHYLVRAKSSNGKYAPLTGIPTVLVELPEPQDLEVVQTYTESPNFTGTFSQAFNSVTEGGITLEADGQIDDITDFDSVTNIDFFGDVVSVGNYIFANTLDLGATYDVELLANLKINTINPDDFWDSRSANIDTWNDIDADDLSETNAELYSRSTNDDPSGSPTYGTWEPFANSTKRGRGFQFKVEMETDNDSQDVVVQTLGVSVKLQRRTEQQRNISSGTGAKAITFPSAFYSTPSITITATNMATGDFFELSSVSRTGFTITFKASGGSIVDRNFDYQAVGHGKEIT
jgi:predicted phage tail protein